MKKIRTFLEVNRVFFELVVALLLSVMAITLSFKANQIAEIQNKIMQEENLPQLEVRMTQMYNKQLKIYDNNVWMVFNRGGKLSDLDTKEYSFYKFIYQPHYDTLLFPLHNYLNMRGLLTGDSEGLVYQVDNNCHGVKELELRDSLSNFGFYEIETFMAIYYTDIFNERHEEFFKIGPSVNRINKMEWDSIENNYKKNNKSFNFSDINAQFIIENIKNSSRMGKY